MTSDDWVSVIVTTYEHIYGLSVFIYPITWALKIAKKIGARGL
jgi:hypothetical protein